MTFVATSCICSYMNNKTKVVRFRCSEEQYKILKEKGGKNMSDWIIDRLSLTFVMVKGFQPPKRETPVDQIVKIMTPKIELPKVEIGIENIQCRSPGCSSLNTKKYHRATGDFFLCDTHKP